MSDVKRPPTLVYTCALVAAAALLLGCGDDLAETPAPPADVDLSTVAVARTRKQGDLAKIEGFVTVAPGTFSSATGDVGFAIQDETGGMYVNIYDTLVAPLDTKVRVFGALADAEGQTVLLSAASSIEVTLGEKTKIAPRTLATGKLAESDEGELVHVVGKVSKVAVDDKPYGFQSFVDDGSGEVRLYICLAGDKPIIDTTKLVPGTSVEVTGFAQQYGATYEIAPRIAADVVLVP